jgi:hypothetical protein
MHDESEIFERDLLHANQRGMGLDPPKFGLGPGPDHRHGDDRADDDHREG